MDLVKNRLLHLIKLLHKVSEFGPVHFAVELRSLVDDVDLSLDVVLEIGEVFGFELQLRDLAELLQLVLVQVLPLDVADLLDCEKPLMVFACVLKKLIDIFGEKHAGSLLLTVGLIDLV